ncbi:MAG: hypothetical protein H7Z72_20870 [Bacteroidetes bacterium]|nr:hypothetical protein [Fibrella sp.]
MVRFDRRTKWYLGICGILFVFFVLVKWHFESIPMWNTIIPDGSAPTRGLIAGKPRQIRIDDYAVGAPAILSSSNRGFPLENEAIGGLRSGLVAEPAAHIISLFRPGSWGFMALDIERGYAFAHLLPILSLLVGAFLLFMIFTKNQFYLSVTGAVALLLSSGTTAWTFIPASMIGYGCAATVAFLYLLHEKRLPFIALQSGLVIFTAISFILLLYPPYQVPLVYLFSLLIVGYVIQERQRLFPLPAIGWKLAALAGMAGLAGVVLYAYYLDAHETIQAVTNTVYPGKRSETGGTGFIANWYSEYYSWFFSDEKFPKSWLNSCEFSHSLTFAPVIIPLSVYLFTIRRQVNWLLLGAMLFTVIMIVWMEVGFPAWLAQKSLFGMVPTRRAQIPMGAGSIMLTVIYLGVINNEYRKVPTYVNIGLVAAVIGFMVYTAYVNVSDSDGFLKGYQTFLVVLFFSAMSGLLLFTLPVRYRTVLFCSGLLLFLLPNLRQNPLSIGLSPITDNALYKTVRTLVEQDPDARWMVNGSQYITYMVTATGAKQITGVKYLPDRKRIMSVLDPTAKRDSAYNRYAHVTYQSYIDGKDSVILVNQFEDAYIIAMDPCSPRMKKLNVKYQIFDHQPQPAEIRCMTLINTLGSLQLYKANP